MLLIALAATPFFARVARAATLVEVHEDYVDALKVVGVPRPARFAFQHPPTRGSR